MTKTTNPRKKIIINCDELNKIKNNKKYKNAQRLKLLSNVSTRKSSDASQVDPQTKNDAFNFNKNLKKPKKNWKSVKSKYGKLILKNNGPLLNSLKHDFKERNIKSLKKGKNCLTKENPNIIINSPTLPPHLNYFLSSNKKCNKIINATEQKENIINSEVCKKKIEPLKLFDYDVSSSSSSSSENSENEEINLGDNNEEKEFIIDNSKYNISSGELSYELNEFEKYENKSNKLNIFEKKLNKKEEKQKIVNSDKEKSCKNICKYILGPNQSELSNKKIIISSVLTNAGVCDDKIKINQDSYLVNERIFGQNFNIYGVFDGHGNNGHLISKHISNFVKDYFSNKFNYYSNENEKQNLFIEYIVNSFTQNYTKIIKNCSKELDKDICTKINYDISQSGSTSTILFLINDLLVCSNVGDSQCYLFNCSEEELWTFELLSKQHLPSDEQERKRIIDNGGEIHPYYEEDGIFEGPDRIYAKNKVYPGLIMSRTIGDLLAKKIGVISDPDIITKKIDNNSKFIVVGSDGLWEEVRPYDIIRMVRPYFKKGDIEGACQVLMRKAIQNWNKKNEERDDITIIVVFIGTPNNYLVKNKNNFLNKIDEIENDD
jgi:serine/threonine protein phosphatase PrpC